MDNIFTAGELIPYSGIYRVTHTPPHTTEESLALKKNEKFPQCVHCSKVSFMLLSDLSRSDLFAHTHKL